MTALHGPALTDPALPAVDRLTDRAELARLLAELDWLTGPAAADVALRLRWKPGTSLRVGAVVPTATGPAAVLIAAFAGRTGAAKAEKLADRTERRGLPVHRDGAVVAVPAAADPALRRLARGFPLSYNPDRRWVGRDGVHATKVHADPLPAGVAALLTGAPAALAAHLPPAATARGGRVLRTLWVHGTHPGPADLPAVTEALAALHATAPPPGLPTLNAPDALAAVRRACRSVVLALPDQCDQVARLLRTLQTACSAGRWPAPDTLVHGDLSPDQVLVTNRAMLLDLDRVGVGPAGWDAAQWTAAQIATGGPMLPSWREPEPVLTLTAALLRAPEPFRRLRPDWPRLTRALLRAAEAAADAEGDR